MGTPYASLTVGVPTGNLPSERRVALSPASVAQLLKKGFKDVLVQPSAGEQASFRDEDYTKAGAKLADPGQVWAADVVLKVRPRPSGDEVKSLKEGSTMIGFLYPAQNKELVEDLKTEEYHLLRSVLQCDPSTTTC